MLLIYRPQYWLINGKSWSHNRNDDLVSYGLWSFVPSARSTTVPKDIDLTPVVAREALKKAPVAVSGSNIYTAWNNASTALHGDAIFFTKSTDGGNTYSNAMVLSPPNTNPKVTVIRNNVNIGAAGSTVAVTWWTNETWALNPVIRTALMVGTLLEI